LFPFSLSLFNFVVVIVFPGLQQTKQTNKEKKSSKHNLQLGIMRRNVKKRSIVFFLSFFLTKKWKNKNCDDSSLAKKQTKK
jgi:hypothetical protein